MENPFLSLDIRLNRIENLLLDISDNLENSKNPKPKVYAVKQLAQQCGISEGTVRNWISEGKIKAKTIGRRIFIEEEEFQKALSDVKSLKYKRS